MTSCAPITKFPPPQGQPPWWPGANGGVTIAADPPPNPISGHFWWDGTVLWMWDGAAWVTDGLTLDALTAMLAANPGLIIPPVVTNGTPAAAGTVGEIWTGFGQGTWNGAGSSSVPPPANLVPVQPPLPAGDWNVTWSISLPPASGSAGVGAALVRLSAPLPAGVLNDMSGYAVNIPNNMAPAADTGLQPLVITGPLVPININLTQALVFNLFIWPSGVMTQGNYTMNVWGRRVR